MNIEQFVEELGKLHFSLSVDKGRLVLKGDRSRLSDADMKAIRDDEKVVGFIRQNKEALIEYLSGTPSAATRKGPENISAIYRLSALQEGLLFHGLYDHSSAYAEQLSCELHAVHAGHLKTAWQAVLERHTILRSSFHYENFSIAVQCVHAAVQLPFNLHDYSGMPEEQQAEALRAFRAADRAQGFDFREAPLMRINLIRLSDDRYLMLWSYHHLIVDGWSMPILMKEVLGLYELLVNGQPIPSVTEDRYESYIRYIEARDKDEQDSFWRQYIGTVETPTQLPFVQARSRKVSSYREDVLVLEEGDTQAVNEFARRHHLTLNTVLQGAWALLLHLYTHNRDVVFGITVSGRPEDLENVEERVGIYTNTLAIRSSQPAGTEAAEWLSRMQAEQLQARDHQYVSLSQVQQLSGLGDSLFDTMITFQNYPVGDAIQARKGSVLQVENIVVAEQTTNYPLSLRITIGSRIKIEFIYKEEEIEASAVARIKAHFRQALMQLTAGRSWNEIDVLTAEEKQKLLSFQAYAPGYDQPLGVLELFAEKAAAHPDACALEFGSRSMSYAELDLASNQLANYLKALRLDASPLIAVCLERSLEMIVSLLAVMKTGAAYVPIDPAYPQDRIDFILEDMKAAAVITSSGFGHLFAAHEPAVRPVWIDEAQEIIAAQSGQAPERRHREDALAYMIYTSGTTGRPKGVLIAHGGLRNMVLNHIDFLGLRPGYRVLQFASFSFDGSCQEIFNTLCSGGTLVLVNQEDILSAERMQSVISTVDIATLPPSYQHVVLDHIDNLKILYSAGEALNVELGRAIEAKGIRLVNGYGPTENTVTITLADQPILADGTVTIGRPLHNVEVYIVDAAGRLVPEGVTGEIWVGGKQVAQGYWNRPELTAEKFLSNPFGKGRIYRTGDTACWLPDGRIRFVGRIDDQVKIRGYRVELGEVELALQQAPGVRQAVVAVADDKDGVQRLAGFVVAEDSEAWSREEVMDHLERQLPEYMVPRMLVAVEEIPMTANGKADKKQLLQLLDQRPAQVVSSPLGEAEQKLAEIWKELLEVESVGREDDFFALGGHSLLAIRLVSAIKKEFDREVGIKEVFDHPTLSVLASILDGVPATATEAITPAERNNHVPLSFFQEQLWFVDRMRGSREYNMPYVFRLKGSLHAQALEFAFRQVINRHEILRTVIVEEEGRGYQRIRPADSWSWTTVEAGEVLGSGQSLEAFVEEFCTRPFDLSKDDMLKVMLVRLGEADHILVALIHHIAFDGWSRAIMVNELVESYRSFAEGRPARLEPLPIQYADYSIWQRRTYNQEVMDRKLAFWTEKLRGLEPLKLLTDYPRASEQSLRGAAVQLRLGSEELDGLNRLCQQEGVTLFMVLLAGFKVLLHRYTGQCDITVGCPVAGRQQKEVEGLIGFFVNTLVLRSEVDPGLDFRSFLKQMRQTSLDAFGHQEVPFEQVVKALSIERDRSRHPLFDVKFQLQNVPEAGTLDLGGVELSAEVTGDLQALMDISLDIKELPGELFLRMTYCSDLYREDTMQRMLGHYACLLRAIVAGEQSSLAELPIMTASEREVLITGFGTGPVDPRSGTILDRFGHWVESMPEATALIFEGEQISYSELDYRANQLALYLRSKGVVEGQLVGLCLDRSLEMIVAIFGILKAGGAYLPLDPAYPKERLAYMLNDSGCKLLVTGSTQSQLFRELASEGTDPIFIDEIDGVLSMLPGTPIEAGISASSLAYVIYTSGSTGQPKGVMIEHGGVVNLAHSQAEALRLRPGISVFQFSSISFDASCYDIFNTLLSGGKLTLSTRDVLLNESEFAALLERNEVELITLPPSYQSVAKSGVTSLKTVVSAGEPLNRKLASEIMQKGIRVINAYGPTENTVCATLSERPLHPSGTVTIGKPLVNVQTYILDAQLNPVPVGVAGDLYLGGAQVARGYLNREELTADRFITNPFGAGRLYQTGDVVRWLEDGNMEYIGRRDEQVKIRGHRIELGEVEAALAHLPEVSAVSVAVKPDGIGLQKLSAYYVPAHEVLKVFEGEMALKQVNGWRELYDAESSRTESRPDSEGEFDISGWNDSFTGEALNAEDMRLWLDDITRVILSGKPGRVLEIGCGKGLIFYRLAGHIGKYIGADFSRASVDHIRKTIALGARNYGEVELQVAPAHEVELKEGETVDTVLLNSIVQYFPHEGYLNDIIEKSIKMLGGKGRIIIGDVRDLRLLRLFRGRLALDRLPDHQQLRDFHWHVDQELLKEEELCFAPEYFVGLKEAFPGITHVDMEWKQGDFVNELSLYRYTVSIYVGGEQPSTEAVAKEWTNEFDTQALLEKLRSGETVLLHRVPNPRLWKEATLHQALRHPEADQLHRASVAGAPRREEEEVLRLIDAVSSAGFEYRMLLDENPFEIQLLVGSNLLGRPAPMSYRLPEAKPERYTNMPLFKDIALLLQKQLREGLLKRLPEYMVPADFIALQRLPLTPSGKADRNFLAQREDVVVHAAHFQGAETEVEEILAAIWQEMLGVDRLGVHDNFFETGGHSLLVVRVIASIRKELGKELTIKDLFDHPTVRDLANLITGSAGESLLPPITRVDEEISIPLSFAQERLWFIDRLQGSTHYHMPWVIRLEGSLNVEALQSAFRAIVDRHEPLRTVIREEEGQGAQVILDASGWSMARVSLDDVARTGTLEQYVEKLITTPFDLSADYMLNVTLIRCSENDHVLVAVAHHIAADGWSVSILIRELVALYRERNRNYAANLPELPVRYRDYSFWQRNLLSGSVLDEKLEYWTGQLEGVQPLELPADYRRPQQQSTRGGVSQARLDRASLDLLLGLSHKEDATLFMTLLSAFAVLLRKYSGQSDICIGSPVAGRPQQEVEGLIGFFINTLALRTRMEPSQSFRSLLKEVKQTTLDAFTHQEIPFEKIVDALGIERDRSRTPVFQVTFNLQNTPPLDELDLGGVQLRSMPFGEVTSKYDLGLDITEQEDGLKIDLVYCRDLFTGERVSRMLEQFVHLLRQLPGAMDRPLSELKLMEESDALGLLKKFNQTDVPYPSEETLVSLFEKQAAATPGAVALVFEERSLTYGELGRLSSALAQQLVGAGVTHETLVPVCLERSAELLVGILAILKAGGAYMPVDPSYPAARMEHMLDESEARVMLSRAGVELPSGLSTGCHRIDVNLDELSQAAALNVEVPLQPSSLAYVLYTSGSTGLPKGVQVEHRNIVSLVKGVDFMPFGREEVILSTGSPSFDASTLEYWGALLNGGRLVLCAETTLLDTVQLKSLIRQQGVTAMWLTSGWFNEVLATDETVFATLKTVLIGGDRLSAPHISRLRELYPYLRIVNGYGPTENTTFSLTFAIEEAQPEREIPVGFPLSNRFACILDESLRVCPIGIPGEICVGGAGLSRGYWKNEALTAERFIADPYRPGERLYRTGDRGCWRKDGAIEYLGRTDQQVKLRGYRIELGEIENMLLRAGDIQTAAVIIQGNGADKKLVAFVVPSGRLDTEAVLDYLTNCLPDYMIPSAFIDLPALPLTANGKVDRNALKQIALPSAIAAREQVAPQTDMERRLADLWKELLEIDEIGIHDNFFELGGHSLLAIRVIAALRSGFDKEVGIKELFDHPTIFGLASFLSGTSEERLLPSIRVAVRPEHVPLSFAQERLWFIDQLQGSRQYHMSWVFQINGALNEAALQSAFRSLVERHEVLRTVIRTEDGAAYQAILPSDPWNMPVMPLDEIRKEFSSLPAFIRHTIDLPFDLSSDPMLRVVLVKKADDEYMLVSVIHHIAFDGWSMSVLIRELTEYYRAYCAQQLPVLHPLPVQYADYAIWQREYLSGEILQTKLSYWTGQLGGLVPLDLPMDQPRKAEQSLQGASAHRLVDRELLDQLLGLCHEEGATLYMTLMAAFQVLLHRYSGQADICVGSPIAGRQQKEVEGLIGFFINTLAIRTRVNGDMPFADLLQAVKKTLLDAYEHQEVPFEKIVDALGLERDMSRPPVFQVVLVLQNTPESGKVQLGDVQLQRQAGSAITSPYDISFEVTESADGLQLGITYCRDLFFAERIQRLLQHFEQLLYSIVSNRQALVSKLQILPSIELSQLTEAFNPKVPAAAGESVLSLFAQRVKEQPDAEALFFDGKGISYRELDARSNQLGHYLVEKGVRPGILVPVCMDRCDEMVVGILGVLKAGGAYLPVDPAYPPSRINYMLKDGGSTVVISKAEYSYLFQVHEKGKTFIAIDKDRSLIASQTDAALTHRPNANDLAYVIYTSGSTGQPKGVAIGHGSLAASTLSRLDYYGNTGRFVLIPSFSFDSSVAVIFGTLACGGSLVICRDEQMKDPGFMAQLLPGADSILCVPFYYRFLLDSGALKPASPGRVILAGEKLDTTLTARHFRELPGAALYNEYGPTEGTVWSSVARIHPNDPLVSIGKPVAHAKLYILDTYGQPVPIGVPGELHIGGGALAFGYLNQPLLTAERFVADPFSGGRMYRTGDICQWMENGEIEYIGRRDEQVKIRGYRIELGEVEKTVQQAAGVKAAVVQVVDDGKGGSRLMVCLVPGKGYEKERVTGHVRMKLPEYMVPSLWIELEALPLTANGKVDRKALAVLAQEQTQSVAAYEAPRNEVEQALAEVWEELLRREHIGIHENFFELGGDSIITIQVVSRLKRKGYSLQPKELFLHQTIARLALALQQDGAAETSCEQGILGGEAGLLPIQQWFLGEAPGSARSHFNQSLMLSIAKDVSFGQLMQAFHKLAEHHDALRFSYSRNENGSWKQQYQTGVMNGLIREDLRELSTMEFAQALQQKADRYHQSLDIEQGDLTRFVWFQTPGSQSENRLLLIIHHLAIDGVSWRILLEDLETLFGQQKKGEELSLGAKTASYRQWHQALVEYGSSNRLKEQKSYWASAVEKARPLKTDKKHEGLVPQAQRGSVSSKLTAARTAQLLTEASKAYHTEVGDLLLTALAQTISAFNGDAHTLIGMEGHGREDLGLDTSHTVGWFTSLYPVSLDLTGAAGPGDAIRSVKEQLRVLPGKGLGYGVLKYIENEAALQGVQPWDIVFNYLGQAGATLQGQWLKSAPEGAGRSVSDSFGQPHKLDVSGVIDEGVLHVRFTYSEPHFHRATVEALISAFTQRLEDLIQHCIDQSSAVYTPSDFGLAGEIGYRELDAFLLAHPSVERLYRLSPLQQGMLFHGLFDPQSSAYVEQFSADLKDLDVDAFRESWHQLLKNHTILRSSFHASEFTVPVQCVHREVSLPVEAVDLRHLDADAQREAAFERTKQERAQGISFSQSPLMRLILMQTGERDYHFIWTYHHLLMDGWSMPVLMEEFLQTYEELSEGRQPQPVEEDRYEDFIRYLAQQQGEKEEQYWKNYLRTLTQGSRLPFRDTGADRSHTVLFGEELAALDAEATQKLQVFARQHHLTVNTIMQGLWAYLLYRYTGNSRVLYGVTVSGRPEGLPGIERRVGLYINTLPFFAAVREDQDLVEWLRSIQQEQLSSRNYQHTALKDIQGWTGITGELFDTLLVFENYPVAEVIAAKDWKLKVERVIMEEDTNFPLCVSVGVGAQVLISFKYNALVLAADDVRQIRIHFEQVIHSLLHIDNAQVGQLLLNGESAAAQASQTEEEDLFNFEEDLTKL